MTMISAYCGSLRTRIDIYAAAAVCLEVSQDTSLREGAIRNWFGDLCRQNSGDQVGTNLVDKVGSYVRIDLKRILDANWNLFGM